MSSAGPWSVKGIDPKAREIAKDLARRSGRTLGEWLNEMIIEGEPEAPPMASYGREPEPRREAQRPVLQAPRRYDADAPPEADLGRITRALDAFSTRLEAAEHRSTLAISGIDQSVMGVLSRLEGIERDQTAIGARFEGSVDEVRLAQAKFAERIRRIEQEDGPRLEAMKALETSVGQVASQVYEGETRARGAIAEVRQDLSGLSRRIDRLDEEVATKADADDRYSHNVIADSVARIADRLDSTDKRTGAAVQSLESSFAHLDARLKSTESRLAPEVGADTPEQRFQKLATDLHNKVAAQRAEMADHMRTVADGKFDRMEAVLRDLAGQLESSEKQSAQAIDRMGREVMRIAQSLGTRVAAVETRYSEADHKAGGEMARIADAIENRMRTADAVQAEALEKLGGEIGRIAERLAERIAASERRAATAIDEVGDQVARVTDKINQRYDRAAAELSDRIRQSEERTAKLLEDARETLDRRMNEAQRRAAFDASVRAADPAPPRMAAEVPVARTAVEVPPAPISDYDDDDNDGFGGDVFPEDDFAPAAGTAAGNAFNDDPFAPPPAPHPAPPAAEAPRFDPPPRFEIEAKAKEFAPPEVYAPPPAPETFADFPAPPPVEPGRNSTRDLIEAARAAARQAASTDGRGRSRRPQPDVLAAPPPSPSPSPDIDAPRGLSAFLSKRKKKRDSSTLRTALLASGTAAGLSMATVGYFMINAASHPSEQASVQTRPTAAAAADVVAPQSNALQTSDADLLAAALAPDSAPAASAPATAAVKPPAKTAAALVPAASVDAKQMYTGAVSRIEAGDVSGLEPLRRAANLGYAPAQFYLAKLHETGTGGVKKDAVEARRWTERAAAAGDTKAMHNLGLYYFEGTGGAKNSTQAAAWFRKAAEAGLKDSQYNLARLYEQGYGVAPNPAEAYKWYLIAAAGGDGEARTSAERLRAQLPQEARTAAERTASVFRQQAPALASR